MKNLITKIRLWTIDKLIGSDLQIVHNVKVDKGTLYLNKGFGSVKNTKIIT